LYDSTCVLNIISYPSVSIIIFHIIIFYFLTIWCCDHELLWSLSYLRTKMGREIWQYSPNAIAGVECAFGCTIVLRNKIVELEHKLSYIYMYVARTSHSVSTLYMNARAIPYIVLRIWMYEAVYRLVVVSGWASNADWLNHKFDIVEIFFKKKLQVLVGIGIMLELYS
jgi:hypothetical protein